jgi:L-malate glycosyltransferase
VPVVSTAVGGIPEIVTHRDTALLVKAGDVAGLAETMLEALLDTDAGRPMAERAHAVIIDRHSPERRTRFLNCLYAEILQGK